MKEMEAFTSLPVQMVSDAQVCFLPRNAACTLPLPVFHHL